ncbi:M20 family metallopeptidase [Sporosarcina siberiensis]|uniref:M20 family metallopeptidase n=1 Tax=Sporosarcina siberiensis TaxID=1365606 RepID=A0ABW4SL94_9BACL
MDIHKLHEDLELIFPKMIEIRRDFHMHPEISFQEVRTPKIIADYLENLGLEVRKGVGGRGVVGILRGGKKGKTIALRADFDALPIQDEKEVTYKSTISGAMHACGHDGHTATLLGVATILAKYKEKIKGNVVFIHQFAEELPPGGARSMIEDGCLDGVDVIFGAHLQGGLPVGEVFYREGYTMAASDFFEIKITGKGGHGASPHLTVDSLVTASQLVLNLQQIVSRKVNPVNPAVLSVGAFNSGSALNVIPEGAYIGGTIRTYDSDTRDLMENELKKLALATCQLSGATCEVVYDRGYDAVWNHPNETNFIRKIASGVVGDENVKERELGMGSEDFAYYLNEVPGSYFFVGAKLEEPDLVYPHHHPRFDFDESAMLITAKVFVSAVLSFNEENSK